MLWCQPALLSPRNRHEAPRRPCSPCSPLPPPPSRATSPPHAPRRRRPRARSRTSTGTASPNLQSSAVLVFDPTTGQTLFVEERRPDHPIASITKLMTAMVVLDAKLPLDEAIQISTEDLDLAQGHAGRACRSAPISAATTSSASRSWPPTTARRRPSGATYPGGISAFVQAMNAKARSLGFEATHFVDSSGLSPGNVSNPTELARMVAEASKYDRHPRVLDHPRARRDAAQFGAQGVLREHQRAGARLGTGTSACRRPATSASRASASSCRR